MIRHLPSIILICMTAPSWAGIYKCEVDGKKAEYQSTPCATGRSVALKVAPSPAPDASTRRSSTEASPSAPSRLDDHLSVDLPNTPLRVVLQVIADFAGYTLVMDPSIKDEGSFNYQRQPASRVLADLARRYGLVVTTTEQTITVKRR